MFEVNTKEISVDEKVGGQPRTSDLLPPECFRWLNQAAAVAEKLLLDEDFPDLFTRHAPPDTCKIRLVGLLRKKLVSELAELKITVNVAEIGDDMTSFVRNVAGAEVNTSTNINKSLLRAMFQTFSTTTEQVKTKAELESQWVVLLAVKMFHEGNHVLLTLLDSPTLRLISVQEDASRCTPQKKFGSLIFNDFGNFMEKAAFGGILGVSRDWRGQDLILASDESWQHTNVVTEYETILRGEMDYVKTGGEASESETEERETKRAKRASIATQDNAAERLPTVVEPKTPAFLPEEDWATAFTKPTKRS